MIDRFEKFSLAIAEINRCWHKIAAEELSKYSLKSSHVTYLLTLARYPEGLTAPKLAELCDRDKADVSRMLSILEEKGLVTKDGIGVGPTYAIYSFFAIFSIFFVAKFIKETKGKELEDM